MASNRRTAGRAALKRLGCSLLLAMAPMTGAYGSDRMEADRPDLSNWREIDRWSGHIREASARFGIPEDWIRRVMRAESGGRTRRDDRPITSPAGAMGLMQLMPGTWIEMRRLHRLGPHPHDPRDNILAGTAYLRAMYDRFGYPGLFAAYNAGPDRYAEHLATGRRLPAETLAYVAAVGRTPLGRFTVSRRRSSSSGVFVVHPKPRPPLGGPAPGTAPASIFVPLSTASPPSSLE